MPIRSEWRIQREGKTMSGEPSEELWRDANMYLSGFTMDTVLSILKHTALNPLYTLPLYLVGLYTQRGREYVANHPGVFKWLKVCLGLGLWQRISGFLDTGAANNWTSDTYDWRKEVVVVTGGSDGIGAIIVKLLAERGIKIVILDIQEPKYVGT